MTEPSARMIELARLAAEKSPCAKSKRGVDAKGTSSEFHTSAWDTMRHNRAGRDETCLSMTQLIDWYCDRRAEHSDDETDGDKPVGVAHVE